MQQRSIARLLSVVYFFAELSSVGVCMLQKNCVMNFDGSGNRPNPICPGPSKIACSTLEKNSPNAPQTPHTIVSSFGFELMVRFIGPSFRKNISVRIVFSLGLFSCIQVVMIQSESLRQGERTGHHRYNIFLWSLASLIR